MKHRKNMWIRVARLLILLLFFHPVMIDKTITASEDVFPVAQAYVYKGTCGENVSWSYNSEENSLQISGTGDMYEYDEDHKIPWYYYRARIQSIVVDEGVTSICTNAFKYFSTLSQVTLASSVNRIGAFAFDESAYYKNKDNWVDGVLYISRHLLAVDEKKLPLNYKLPDDLLTIGSYAFSNCDKLVTMDIPDSVKYVGDNAFAYCSSLTSVRISDAMNEICNDTFAYCEKLESVTFGENTNLTAIGAYAFKNCVSLQTIDLPSSITMIGTCAFENCMSIPTVRISKDLQTIGENAFSGCSSVVSFETDAENEFYSSVDGVLYNKNKTTLINYPAASDTNQFFVPQSVTRIESFAFMDCLYLTELTLGDSVQEIAPFAFDGCSSLQSILLSNSITEIYPFVFSGCSGLTKICIPDSVVCIYNSAFDACISLSEIDLPDGLQEIEANAFEDTAYYADSENWVDGVLYLGTHLLAANNEELNETYEVLNGTTTISSFSFYGCANLKEVVIPDSVTRIGSQAFYLCEDLQNIKLSKSLTHIGYAAFEETAFCNDATQWDNGVLYLGNCLLKADTAVCSDALIIRENVVCIAEQAFSDCDLLTSVRLPYGLETVADAVFYDCNALQSVFFPITIKTIEESAFYGCSSLQTVQLQKNVASIGMSAFAGCAVLTDVYLSENLERIGDMAFAGCENLISVYVAKTQDQWNLVSIGVDNHALLHAEMHYGSVYDPFLIGDVNCDGTIDSSDARMVLRAAVGLEILDSYCSVAADVDKDSVISSTDARYVLRYSVGIIDPIWPSGQEL